MRQAHHQCALVGQANVPAVADDMAAAAAALALAPLGETWLCRPTC